MFRGRPGYQACAGLARPAHGMEELLGRLLRGTPIGSAERELALLDDIAMVARDASICGLGQTAVGAAQSAVRLGLIGGARTGGTGTAGTGTAGTGTSGNGT